MQYACDPFVYILYHNTSVTENNINDKVEYAYYNNNNKNNTVYGNTYYIVCSDLRRHGILKYCLYTLFI